jgi:hypothetical protein
MIVNQMLNNPSIVINSRMAKLESNPGYCTGLYKHKSKLTIGEKRNA